MALELYSDPVSARRAPPSKGGDLVMYVNQAPRYFWPFLPLIDTDGINLPTLKKNKPELFYQVTPDLPSGLILDSKTGLVNVIGTELTPQETIHYTFTVLYEFNIIYNTVSIKIEPCPPSTCLELTVNQKDIIFSLPYTVMPNTSLVLPEGIYLLPTLDKLAINGAKLCPQGSKEYVFETKNGVKFDICIIIHQSPYFENHLCKTIPIKIRLTVGKKEMTDLPVIKGGAKPFVYESKPSLPAGLQIDAGQLLGAAQNTLDLTTYVITAYDSNGVSTSNVVSLDLSVHPALYTESECDDCLCFTVNQKDTTFCPIDTEGGYEPYVYSVSPTLPQGFRLNRKTGHVTVRGKDLKSMKTTKFTFKVVDDNGTCIINTICLTVNSTTCVEACDCGDIVLTENQKDKVLTVLKTEGGTYPLIYSVNPDLPLGIKLNSLNGELQVTGSQLVASEKAIAYTFTVVDKCSVRVVAFEVLKIRVTSAPTAQCYFSCSSDYKNTTRLLKPKHPKNNSFDIALTINKPTEFTILRGVTCACPLTYYISKGSLPDFLTLDPRSGVLSGTPIAESKIPYDAFTIAVKDKNDVPAAYECDVTIVIQSKACFPGNALVKLENGQTISLTELKIGDKIQTGANRVSEVYLFTHALPLAETPFIELTTANGHTIVLSAGHYLYVNGTLAKAEAVKLNDILRTEQGESNVTLIEYVRETGLYNPHTLDGDIMINGVCTSTYTDALRPDLAHSILGPVRYLYSLR